MAKKRGAARKAARKKMGAKARKSRTKPIRPDSLDAAEKKILAQLDARKMSGAIWPGKAPVEGDTIIGEVLSMKEEKGKFGPQSVILIGTNQGAKTVFGKTILDREIAENKVAVGDRIGIQFKGTAPSGKGRPAQLFAVVKLGKGARKKKRR